ncbi:hypothetical protein F7725_021701 [Dissostichus mawsoni]|uniref:F-box domain-containing protein n=1 Tax=Dissostichus mawsoni TaxID=36200 RepID=A0A7J5ZBZ1_DISMA|nr:hypothetical protein F7725_021701 [Dissostichus mawsoni]
MDAHAWPKVCLLDSGGQKLARGNPSASVQSATTECQMDISQEKLPEGIIRRILRFVVLEDGDPAICTLALTCKNLNYIVSQGSFQKEPTSTGLTEDHDAFIAQRKEEKVG